MWVVDSCGWLEWFSDGLLADQFHPYLSEHEQLIVPTIVLYEVYKVLKRTVGEEKALQAVGFMKKSSVVMFDDTLALAAADISLAEGLAMADAMILAISRYYHCTLITSDADLQGRVGVNFIPKAN
jgi:toxin FitB